MNFGPAWVICEPVSNLNFIGVLSEPKNKLQNAWSWL